MGAVVLAVAVVVVAVGGLAFASRYGGVGGVAHKMAHQFTSSDTSANPRSSGAGRLLALGSNGRIPMAREGLQRLPRIIRWPARGAGTFRFTNYLYRPNGSFVVKHAHNQWINVLSELGLVGFVLVRRSPSAACWSPRCGRWAGPARDADRGLLAALQAASIAFVAHMTIDWDWDMAAAARRVPAARRRRRRLRARPRAAPPPAKPVARPMCRDGASPTAGDDRRDAVADCASALASRVLATGVLALVAVSCPAAVPVGPRPVAAIVLASDNRTAAAVAQARRAHRLDPLAVDPLFTLALVEQQQGRAARR